MSLLDRLQAAFSAAVSRGPQQPVAPCAQQALPTVSPQIVVAAPRIVLVRKAYQTRGHRLAVTLSTNVAFTGTGTLDAAPAGQLRVYDPRGTLQALPMALPGSRLSQGVTFYVEGQTPSAGMNSTRMSLTLAGGDKAIVNSPTIGTLTCVEVQLDLCRYKPAPGGADRLPVTDRINTGRNLHVQTPTLWAGRGLLIVRQARPAAYPGNVILTARNNRVRCFDYTLEGPAPAQPVQPDPLSSRNATLQAGLRLWVEGANASASVLDTGFTLGISDLPGVEGDRANITVIKAVLAVYNRPPRAGARYPRLTDAEKLDPGRRLHLQDAGNQHWRARVVVKRVTPSSWTGDLELQVCDSGGIGAAINPRLRLVTGTAANSPVHNNPISHATIPRNGQELWVEGAVMSGALRDAEVRLRVTDAEGYADRGAFTVHVFYVKQVRFRSAKRIYYARIPTPGSSYILPPAADLPARHLNPCELRPAANTEHWKRMNGQNPAAEFSWPAVYIRRNAPGDQTRDLSASFELFPQVAGVITEKVKADGGATGITIKAEDVTFTDGVSPYVLFEIENLPATVKYLDGMELEWGYDGPSHRTRHTLFVVDKLPERANNGYSNEYLWEIFEWSCRWADGVTGANNVFARIWSQFHPVRNVHDTGLVYWRNYQIIPFNRLAQSLADAIQSQEPLNHEQNAATCVVFDRVLINCVSAHGIPSAEIQLEVPAGTFLRNGVSYVCTRWVDTTTAGQGNPQAPPRWMNHWIAAVNLGGWKYYDASYGEGPTDAPVPGAAGQNIDVSSYEPRTVAAFEVRAVLTGVVSDIPRIANPASAPHLVGTVLWRSS